MLHDLNKRNNLLRCYSQNIDGLESKVGFKMDSTFTLSDRCIPLHGSLHFLRCTICTSTHLFQNHHAVLESGHFPLCHLCQQEQDERSAASLRCRNVGQLRPDTVLYGEYHLQGEEIAAAQKHDLTLDLLLVVGTSLKVPGTAHLIKEFSKQLHNNGLQHSIYINKTAPSSEWHNTFDMFMRGDCQIFAKYLRQHMGATPLLAKQNEKEDHKSILAYMEDLETRQDFRPSWRWL
jgi:NAD-dependent histone deacetylase SIR2